MGLQFIAHPITSMQKQKVVLTTHKYKVARRQKIINTTCNYFRFISFRTTNIFGSSSTLHTTSTHHVKFHIHQVSHQISHTLNHPHYNKIYWNQFNDQLDLSTISRIANTNIANVILFQALFHIHVYSCASVAHYSFFTQYDQDKIRINSWIT